MSASDTLAAMLLAERRAAEMAWMRSLAIQTTDENIERVVAHLREVEGISEDAIAYLREEHRKLEDGIQRDRRVNAVLKPQKEQ